MRAVALQHAASGFGCIGVWINDDTQSLAEFDEAWTATSIKSKNGHVAHIYNGTSVLLSDLSDYRE